MGVLNIFGRLSLDGGNFKGTLDKAEKQADKFAASTVKKLAGAATGFAGFNALKQMGLQAIDNAGEISKLAREFSLTTDQVQQLQEEAKNTGKPFSELVKDAGELEKTLARIDGNNVVFSRETVENLTNAGEAMKTFKDAVGERVGNIIGGLIGMGEGVKMTPEQRAFEEIQLEKKRAAEAEKQGEKERLATEEKIKKINEDAAEFETKARDAGLVKAEKIVQLEKERARILRDIEIAPFEDGTEGAANDRLRLAKVNASLAELRKDDSKAAAVKQRITPLSDSLRSVGNFLGGSTNSPEMATLREANRLLKQIEANTKKGGGATFPL